MSDPTAPSPAQDPLTRIADDLGAIRQVLEAGHEAAERSREQARAAIDAQAASREASRVRAVPPAPDFHPFAQMPPGTTVRDLPDGGRLFLFSDGSFLRLAASGELTAITGTGEAVRLAPARGGKVVLPDGRELQLKPEALRVRHTAAGISGLPDAIEPLRVAEGRYSLTLPDGTRLDVSHADRLVSVITTVGTIVIVGARLDSVGELLDVRSIPAGRRTFSSSESRVRGIVDADGTVQLVLPNGPDLVIRFPQGSTPELPTLPSSPGLTCSGGRS